MSIFEYVSDLDGRYRSVPPPFQVRFKSVPLYRRYKPHDREESFGEVKTMVINVEPWFVGKDVAMMLGYAQTAKAIREHVEEEDKSNALIQCTGSNYKSKTMLTNESGLYALILSSKLPQAKEFKRWVTSED